MPLTIFATKFKGASGTIGKCAAKFLGATGFCANYFFQLNQAL